LLLARWLNSIKMTAMMGTGLMATPTAWGRIALITFPIVYFLQTIVDFVK
jgi:hypothetical protein